MPNNAPKTAAAFDAATLQLAEREERRKHLGASQLGHKCDRKIWYGFRWAFNGQPHSARVLRLFRRGHREEPEIIRILRGFPATEVWDAGDAGEHKEALRITFADGHGGGTADGAISQLPDFPGEPALLEFKTMSDDEFEKVKSDGVMTAKWGYFVQSQLYLSGLSMPRQLFIAINKNNDEAYFEIISSNESIAEEYRNRALAIVRAEAPPDRIADSPGFWVCKYCDFQKLCHFRDIPAITCRSCVHASVGPNGSWLCARSRPEITNQGGCAEHLFDPSFFIDGDPKFEVIDWDLERNWIKLFDGVSVETWGPNHTSSQRLCAHGFVPF